ncbi:MAG: multiheme c-type cytochrome [Bacteroidota bacterium]
MQLPVSYYTPNDAWSSSPGNPPDRFVVNRPVTAPCLNCHSTHFNPTYQMNMLPEFDRQAIILGIDCERCHGPGLRHVLNREKGEVVKRDIINPANLTRQQQLDACAQCHSGITTDLKPPFTFLPGDTLVADRTSFQRFDTTAAAEVHGNQYGLLTSSKCFIQSELTCSNCHQPHTRERGFVADCSARCMS